MLNIMVGLRKSIKALYELNSHLQIKDHHFTEQHEFFLGNKSFLSGKGPGAASRRSWVSWGIPFPTAEGREEL